LNGFGDYSFLLGDFLEDIFWVILFFCTESLSKKSSIFDSFSLYFFE